MTTAGIAARYALALVEAATAPGSGADPKQILADLDAFAGAVAEARDLRLVLHSPAVSVQRKRAVIGMLADRMNLSRLVRNTILVLNDHRRMTLLKEVRQEYEVLLDRQLGFQQALVSAAAPLSDDEQRSIASILERITGRRIRMKIEIEPDLIGGVIARVGSTIYDGSVRGQLEALRERLAAQSV